MSVLPVVDDPRPRLDVVVAVVGITLHARMIAVSAITIDVIVTAPEARMTGIVR